MSVLNRIAHYQGHRDEVPNRELARELAARKDVPQHSEKSLPAVDANNKDEFIAVLEKRMEHLSGAQVKRVNKVIEEANRR